MMLLTGYESKKELKEAIGKPLLFEETSMFSAEYKSNGTFCAAHRPSLTGYAGREFFAKITIKNDLIENVS